MTSLTPEQRERLPLWFEAIERQDDDLMPALSRLSEHKIAMAETIIEDGKTIAAMRDALGRTNALLARYRKETPPGHSPHMICHKADEVITANNAILNDGAQS